jgi:penicillin-binding protein 2
VKHFEDRKYIIGAIFIAFALLFIIRLFYVQILSDEYAIYSEDNVVREETVYPPRGLLYDRNNKLLVYNEASYDLMVIPKQLKKIDTLSFCALLGISKQDFIDRITKAKEYSYYKPSIFEKEISAVEFASIQEKLFAYDGFFIQTRTLRKYSDSIAAHVLGYIGEVAPEVVSNDSFYTPGDYIGKSGLELQYENILRGNKGKRFVLVDVHNRVKGKYKNGEKDIAPRAGKNLQITLDAELQKYAEKLMQNKLGSVVAIEPSTGEILTMVSSPTYNPNLLIGRAIKKNFPKLAQDSLHPLFNRAIMSLYPPGSIFKLVQSAIAMQEQVITPYTGFACNKSLVGCHNHPFAKNIKEAVKMSCNPYYYQVFKRLIQRGENKNIFIDSRLGLEKWHKSVLKFGLGHKLGIDIPGEKSGFIPDVAFYDKWYGKNRWAFSTIYSLSIGQGEIGVVPVQMANLAAIMANRGYYYTPHFIKQIENSDTIPAKYTTKHSTGISPEYYEYIIDGMEAVVNEQGGTAGRARIDSIIVCGKTGTAQNPHGEDHSVFIAFAPKENPKIAVAVFVENSGFGGTWAAPIASLIIEKYIKGFISNKLKEKRILEADLIPKTQNAQRK